jgi:RHS repeat-associated protein
MRTWNFAKPAQAQFVDWARIPSSTSASGGPTGIVHYIYDLDGHLLAEANGSATGTSVVTTREYIWLPDNDNHQMTPGGTVGQSLGLGSLAANDNSAVDLPLAIVDTVNTTPALLMVHSDHLGRPTRLTDATKATVWQATYKPWGEVQSTSGTRANNLRFPGQYFQIETNLAYNWHRHYDPVTGRYTQPDPLRFVDGPSIYAYAGNSPLKWTDRLGLYATPDAGVDLPHSSKPGSGGGTDFGATCSPGDPPTGPQIAFNPWSLVKKQNFGGGITICIYKHFGTGEYGQGMGSGGQCPHMPS